MGFAYRILNYLCIRCILKFLWRNSPVCATFLEAFRSFQTKIDWIVGEINSRVYCTRIGQRKQLYYLQLAYFQCLVDIIIRYLFGMVLWDRLIIFSMKIFTPSVRYLCIFVGTLYLRRRFKKKFMQIKETLWHLFL